MAEKTKEPKSKEVVIRRAEIADAISILKVLKKHIRNDLDHLPEPNHNDMIRWIIDIIDTGLVLVADMGGNIFGSIGGKLGCYPWNLSAPLFIGEWYCILPGYSEKKVGVALLQKARSIANMKQINVMFTLLGTNAADEKERLMHLEGFTDCGGVLILKSTLESEEPLWVSPVEE